MISKAVLEGRISPLAEKGIPRCADTEELSADSKEASRPKVPNASQS